MLSSHLSGSSTLCARILPGAFLCSVSSVLENENNLRGHSQAAALWCNSWVKAGQDSVSGSQKGSQKGFA